MDELHQWLEASYERAFGTACLITDDTCEAAEAVHEAFLRAWRFRHSFPSGGGYQRWLYRALISGCSTRRGAIDQVHGAAIGEPTVPPAGTRGWVRLRDDLRLVLILHDWAALSESEIATALRCRPRAVTARLLEARRNLSHDVPFHHTTQEA